MSPRASRRPRLVVLAAVAAAALGTLGTLTVDAAAVENPNKVVVKLPPNAGKPVPGSGIGTAAAVNDPRCHVKSPTTGLTLLGGYGRWDSTAVGGGPICVRRWKDGDDNGGATSQGVTRDRVKVVAVVPNEQQIEIQNIPSGTAPMRRADSSRGTYEDAIHDHLIPQMRFFNTWGRDVEIVFHTSSGDDEAAQRADVVAIKAMKPFAVFHLVVQGLDVLETELAKDKIPVMGYSTTAIKAQKQAPYRWGLSDAQSSAINSAEVIGKQLVGKKAEFAGSDAIKSQTRKFGIVYIPTLVDIDNFKQYFAKHGGKIAAEFSYPANGSTFGDAAVSDPLAPTAITKMKSAGVTTIILLSDFSMNKTMMESATKQEYYPEWFFTGAIYADIGLLARNYPPEQSAHAFGLSFLAPYTYPDPLPPPPAKSLSVLTNPLNWYWGEQRGTSAPPVSSHITWLLNGIHAAGPKLTPKTFQQGLFSIPASGGAATGSTTGFLSGYGKGPGLPYDSYFQNGLDFAPYWWDPETEGPSNGTGVEGKGVGWYADGAKRYTSGSWPKKRFGWFDKTTSVYKYDTRQTPPPIYVGDCEGCPSTGGPGLPGSPSKSGFVARAGGVGSVAV